MPVQSQVSDQNLGQTQNPQSLTLQWGDLEGHFVSLQNSMEARLREIEIKETQVNDRLREFEAREKRHAMKLRSDMASLGSKVIVNGHKLLDLICESVFEQEKLCESVRRELSLSDEPGKLVIEAVGELFRGNVKLGNVGMRSCVVLLEQLAAVGPRIGPAARAEAAGLASEWRARIAAKGEKKKGVLEVLGFLLLLGAYDLVDEFESGQVLSLLRSIGKVRVGESGVELGLADHDLASVSLVSQEKASDRSLDQDLELVNKIASAFTSPFDALKCFCVDMDGTNLKLFLHQYLGEQDWSTEVHDALSQATDPAKLVLDTMPGFLRPQLEFHKSLSKARVRKSCILLLEQLMSISPPISPNVREEAFKVADEWRLKMGQIYQSPVTAYGLLLFLSAYKLNSKYEIDELLRILEIASQYKASPELCQAIGLASKVEVLVDNLIQKAMMLDAVDYIYAYGLVGKFSPVQLLADYLNLSKQKIHKQGDKLSIQQAADKEIAVIRTIIRYISKYRLESKLPPEELEKQISELEKMKRTKVHQRTYVPNARVSSANTMIDSQVKVEPSPKEDSQLNDQAKKAEPSPKEESQLNDQAAKAEPSPKEGLQLENQVEKAVNEESLSSTSRWPRLESMCVSMYGKGLSFFSRKHKQESGSTASLSTSPWPELESFCVNMDGKSLRKFLYDHVDDQDSDQDSLCGAVRDALRCASDPAKLVLDVMPGCLRSQPDFDDSLMLNKVRNSRILLLEQLITISPQISPCVKEESLKMANEWRDNLGKKYHSSGNVYGFLHFIAAYGLMSNYEADELLSLLISANHHKATPSLCRILGLSDKVLVLIENLRQKNLLLEAIEHIYAFEVVDMYRPVRLLKDYVYSKRTIYVGSKLPSKNAIKREIAAVRSVIACIAKYKLESQYPPEDLEKHITELEKLKARVTDVYTTESTSSSSDHASSATYSV